MTHEELVRKNDRLASALRAARQELATVQEQVRQLSTTPNTFGVIVRVNLRARTADVLISGRKVRCAISETVAAASLFPGREVILNDHMSIVNTSEFEDIGDIFGFGRQRRSAGGGFAPQPGADMEITLPVSFEEATQGASKQKRQRLASISASICFGSMRVIRCW